MQSRPSSPSKLAPFPPVQTSSRIKNMGIETTVFRGGPEGKIAKSTVQKEDLKNDEVLVKVTHSGLCGTDMHFLNSGIVLGHEGAGIVEAVAPGVEVLKK